MLQIPCQLEENLQTVDAGDADIPDGADFVGAEELDGSRTLIEIVLYPSDLKTTKSTGSGRSIIACAVEM